MGRASRMLASKFAADLLAKKEQEKAHTLDARVKSSKGAMGRLSVIDERWETDSEVSASGSIDSAASTGSTSGVSYMMGLLSSVLVKRRGGGRRASLARGIA